MRKVTQDFLSVLDEYLSDETSLKTYAIISAENKVLPRIEMQIESETDHDVLRLVKNIDLNVRLVMNVKDGTNEELQYDLEAILNCDNDIITFVEDSGLDVELEYWKLAGSDVEVQDGNLIVSFKIEAIIQ